MSDFKYIQDNWDQIEPQLRQARTECKGQGLVRLMLDADGLALQSPTPEQIDTDIIGELSKFRQKIADLETARAFHMTCIDNLVERLNVLESKSQFRFAEGYHKGREAILRTNQSGCCCIVNDSDEIVSVCGAHEQWGDNLLKKLKTIEDQFLEILSHGCCIPACSKHRGPDEKRNSNLR